ncbi:unnamed protein product [Ranitomeya imitator]|uniref:C2H2-type domain-containing protein n=1 Tax=Ranitomeya imitator TaxID=111125 RepID=A0ABN9LUZ4_9NEOB|nr:unnamed protein product [Ranitomeya imitator]
MTGDAPLPVTHRGPGSSVSQQKPREPRDPDVTPGPVTSQTVRTTCSAPPRSRFLLFCPSRRPVAASVSSPAPVTSRSVVMAAASSEPQPSSAGSPAQAAAPEPPEEEAAGRAEEDEDDEEDEEEDEESSSSGGSERSDSPAGSSLDGERGSSRPEDGPSPGGSIISGSSSSSAPSTAGSSTAGSSSGADDGYSSAGQSGRRTSLEGDGEPLSRMDSEDSRPGPFAEKQPQSMMFPPPCFTVALWSSPKSVAPPLHTWATLAAPLSSCLRSISSTLMDVDSTISSGRSTPAMMIGQGLSATSSKSLSYSCCWDQCQTCFSSSPDLAEHLRSLHVDGQRGGVFVCFWKGCKVYNRPSTSQSWLQRHMLTHSGDKPFKCVVGGCNASFASQGGLARHVPTHFSQQNSSKLSGHPKSKEESPSKAGLTKRRKLKNKRKRSLPAALGSSPYSSAPVQMKARPHDFFDAQTLDAIRHRAICFNLSAQIESLGNGHSVVFHSTVIAKRKEDSGKIKFLLHWTPEDILPDVWVNEGDWHQLKTKVVHLSKLPKDTALLLDPNIYRAVP